MYEMTGESLSSNVSTVRTFGKGGGGHPSEFYLVRAATTVRADVNTMLDVLRTSTSEDFRTVMKKIFHKQFESGAVVDSLSCTTPPPYAPSPDSKGCNGGWQLFSEDDGYSANWITLRAFTKLEGLDGPRDFTMICYQDVFERAYISDKLTRVGRRASRDPHRPQPVTGSRLIGVYTFSSMNFRDIPELPKSSKTDRLHFRNSGVIVEELVEEDANGPTVRVSLLLSLMPAKLVLKEVSQSPRMRVAVAAGHEVAKKYRKWLQTLALGVSHLAEAAKPAVTMQHLSKMTWTESDRCYLCLKTFRTYRRRHRCRFCGEAYYQQQKMSFSTISSSSYSGLSRDERAQLALYASTSSAEFMGKPPPSSTSVSSNPTPSSFTPSDASLSAFLARDPDILSLNGLTLSPGGSVAPSATTAMDDDEHNDFTYKHSSVPPYADLRSSYATTAATNEGSNHSQFNYANMTPQEVQATERLLREANTRGNTRINGQPPLDGRRHQPQYKHDYDQSPVELANKKVYHVPGVAQSSGGFSPSHSQRSSYSSGSARSDLIQLNPPAKTPAVSSKMDLVVFDDNRQAKTLDQVGSSNDMIPLTF
ncbi:hypothetical protein PHYSODRAFT_565213 [Phytophthora sojae]|uniref:FYVE zinc finger domain-containing protein n=1 Tax=Phytophthora sojae (strain P6497) TaxID=1094619 RepID=G5A9F7_PHYSP|nr:hypothetical protein PHYSODRAFT_565213 [Phytophthora sojae]EGZ08532.1 hypothetical protein PHYSODRAFT_565213 [Phytophthora sojae]|eukprot:XP_009536704.1 hypothetical protein PHYSODRAFT_565213 [Phytophthora sojae]